MVIALKDQDGETQDKIRMRNQAKKTHHNVRRAVYLVA